MNYPVSRWPVVLTALLLLRGLAAGFPNVVQEHYQWMNDDGMEATSTSKAAADTPLVNQVRDQTLRLRFALANTDTLGGATGARPRLEFSTNRIDLYSAVPVNASSGEPFEMVDTVHYTNNVTLTTDRLAGTGTFLPGGLCVEDPANTTSPFDIDSLRYVNVEYCLKPTVNAVSGWKYYFRLTDFGTGVAVELDGYNHYAELTLVGPPQVDNDGGATDVATTSATLHGQIVDTGGMTPTATFYWGTADGTTNKTGPGAWEYSEPMGPRSGAFSRPLNSLLANETYFYRTYATNAAGDDWAATTSFKTDPPDVALAETFRVVNETDVSVTLEVNLAAKSAIAAEVDYDTVSGSATSVGDYTNASGTLTWPADTDGAQSITVNLMDDSVPESAEVFYIVLSAPSDCRISGSTTCTVAIIDNDGAPTIQFAQFGSSGDESISPTNLPVTLSAPAVAGTTVKYAVVGGTAIAGDDYILASGTLSVNVGATLTNIALQVTDDSEYESSETVIVELSDPTSATVGIISNYTYTIEDADIGLPEVDNWIGAKRIRATGATLRGRVIDTRRQDPTVYVYWGETNGDTNKPGSPPPGAWSNEIVVGTVGVGTFETNITAGLMTNTLYYYRCYASNDAGGAWATNVENFIAADPPVFPLLSNESMEDMGANETTPAHWQPSANVVRTNEFARTGSYGCRVDNAANEYIAGVDNNLFRNAWNGQYFSGAPHPSGGIRPGFVLSGKAHMRARVEGSDGATFHFGLRNYTDDSNWISNNLATNNVVYQEILATNASPMSASLVGKKMGPVMLRGDTGGAAEERYHVDDFTVTVSLPRLVLSRDPTNPVAYPSTPFGLSSEVAIGARSQGGGDGTVLYGAYVSGAGDLVSPAWNGKAWHEVYDPSNAFEIVAGQNLVATNDEAFQEATIRFTPPGEYAYTGVVRIATTDPADHYFGGGEISPYNIRYERFVLVGTGTTARALSISDASVTEGHIGTKAMSFTVSIPSQAPVDVTVQYDSADHGSAGAGSDYGAASGTATITAGNTSTNILVTVSGDVDEEPDETFEVNLSNPSNATIADGQGVGTIENDDGYVGPKGAVFRIK